MSMLDSFFTKGFKAAKCKTLLKLTIPRIKLLRNRREIQIKQMRREIAKLLETGQEATARIRVEHIIREEKMMAAQEIVELFCELIAVRLPIIEVQRECPLDLKEAISSVCFAAPRCADLPELIQVQMLFAAKYGKEFVAAATELMPECGVNRQLVELLSVRAPDPDVKLKLLKDIAEEHELEWDPASSETELLKSHDDLLDGPTQFVGGSKVALPGEKQNESVYTVSEQAPIEESDNTANFDAMDLPEVPKASVRQNVGTVSAPEMLPFPEVEFESNNGDDAGETFAQEPELVPHKLSEQISSVAKQSDSTKTSSAPDEDIKQFVPFISPPLSSKTCSVRQSEHPQSLPRTKSKTDVDLQDVLAAAEAAAESAERAAAAARSAASLAQVRISELVTKRSGEIPDVSSENPFHSDTCKSDTNDKPQTARSDSFGDTGDITDFSIPDQGQKNLSHPQLFPLRSFDDHNVEFNSSSSPAYGDRKAEFSSSQLEKDFPGLNFDPHQPQRLPSMDGESFFSYPNLFKRQDSGLEVGTHSSGDVSRSTHKL